MKMQNITNFMVGAMDDKILASLARRSIPSFSMQSGEQGGLQWQSSNCSRTSSRSSSCKGWRLSLKWQWWCLVRGAAQQQQQQQQQQDNSVRAAQQQTYNSCLAVQVWATCQPAAIEYCVGRSHQQQLHDQLVA
jgi:hypothetical protein